MKQLNEWHEYSAEEMSTDKAYQCLFDEQPLADSGDLDFDADAGGDNTYRWE